MDAVMYLKEKARMTRDCELSCIECPISSYNNGMGVECKTFQRKYTKEAVSIVEKWSNTHPEKTYLMDFLKKYQSAKIDTYGIPYGICVEHLAYIDRCKHNDEPEFNCKKCWNTPMEE